MSTPTSSPMITQRPVATPSWWRPWPRPTSADPDAEEAEHTGPKPAYDFEPSSPSELLKTPFCRATSSARIFSALLESAASESAARRRAMKSASDNASRSSSSTLYAGWRTQARQAEITQEISEIVGGADALAAAGSEITCSFVTLGSGVRSDRHQLRRSATLRSIKGHRPHRAGHRPGRGRRVRPQQRCRPSINALTVEIGTSACAVQDDDTRGRAAHR